jgi:molecular chaperone HtpG
MMSPSPLTPLPEGEGNEEAKAPSQEEKWEQVNETKSIWNKNKSAVKDEEYNEFYSSLSYDFNKPLTHIHLNTE